MLPIRRSWFAFATLCLLSGSTWLLDESHPSQLSAARQLFVQNLLLAVVFAAATSLQATWPTVRESWRAILNFAVLGQLVFAVPMLLVQSSGVSSTTSALIFLAIPSVVVFVESQRTPSFGPARSPFTLLAPALAGLMGACLILPFSWPSQASAQLRLLLLIASAIAAGVAVARMHHLMAPTATHERMPVLPALTSLCAVTAIITASLALHGNPWNTSALPLELLRSTIITLPVLLLTALLLREQRPPVFASRAFFILVITLAESDAILRPQLTWPTLLGIALLLFGAICLLHEDSPEPSFTPARQTIDS